MRIAISMGDYNGIGPEIILKTLQKIDFEEITPVLLGHASVFSTYAEMIGYYGWSPSVINTTDEIKPGVPNIVNCVNEKPDVTPGMFSGKAGTAAMESVEAGINTCLQNKTDALVTAPISKEAINKGGYPVPGHTEFLAEKTGTDNFMMMLVHDHLRVGLVTIHEPVSKISGLLTEDRVFTHIQTMHRSLQKEFRINTPNIAVLGLNPHAGDGGVIGSEEIEIITPAILKAEKEGIHARGPFPADGFFGNRKYNNFDGVLAMYHDQGLVPFKTLSFGGGVNVTTGLPIVRTSPDHGTAFDIAGQDKADPSSFFQALKLAAELSNNRL